MKTSRHSLALMLLATALAGCSGNILGLPLGGPGQAPVTVKSTSFGECAREVAEVSLTAATPQANFKMDLVSPGAFRHQLRVMTINTSSFTSGTLHIEGTVGTGQAAASFVLLDANPAYPCSGFVLGGLQSASNIKPGASFSLNQTFSKGQVYRLVGEGSWDAPKDSTNTADIKIRVD